MVPSPHKRAQRASFDQTWDDTDAAFLDPNALPVVRIPRGWERKQEVKKTEEGKDRTIWRRFNLRSRASDTTEEEHEEEDDAQSRAVKRQQHVSPKAMERTGGKALGKKRAFKATRWDRRKSALPRKRGARTEETFPDAEEAKDNEDSRDATNEDLIDNSLTELATNAQGDADPVSDLPQLRDDRRATFSFTADAPTVDQLPDNESMFGWLNNGSQDLESPTPMGDSTITRLFQTPAKSVAITSYTTLETIRYPTLPRSDSEQPQFEAVSTSIEEPAALRDENEITESGDENGISMHPVDTAVVEEGELLEAGDPNQTLQESSDLANFNAPVSHVPKPTKSSNDVDYPALPTEACVTEPADSTPEIARRDTEMPDAALDVKMAYSQDEDDVLEGADETMLHGVDEDASEEEFTEASLQLSILKKYEQNLREEKAAPELASEASLQTDTTNVIGVEPHSVLEPEATGSPAPPDLSTQSRQPQITQFSQEPTETAVDDITDGLTLGCSPIKPWSAEPTPRKIRSPLPPPIASGPDDATTAMALDDDTAVLKDFLSRAAANKAEKAAVLTHRRESSQNRRDSDVIRHALASPRKALEAKDPNSPSKYGSELALDLSQTLALSVDRDASPEEADTEDATEATSGRTSRRSSRTKKSRLPAPASATQMPPSTQTSKIAIRRVDGTEHVVLKKSDAQELATLTRANTRKNKQGAFGVIVSLMKLAVEEANLPPMDDATKELIVGKNIRWDEQLVYYQENPETIAVAESLATPDELSMLEPVSTPRVKTKSKISKSSTPKIRRVRGLGTTNGTPGKGLLSPASLLPEAVQEEKKAVEAPAPVQQLPRPKASRVKKMPVSAASTDPASTPAPSGTKLATLDIVPVGVPPTKERKSRLAAPKKITTLPVPTVSMPAEGKENTQRTGLSAGTPKKGIPAPKVVIPPTMGMESGLPRRRGRKI